jgi:hypothetical protein
MIGTPWALAFCTIVAAAVESTGSSTIALTPWASAESICCCCFAASESAFW